MFVIAAANRLLVAGTVVTPALADSSKSGYKKGYQKLLRMCQPS